MKLSPELSCAHLPEVLGCLGSDVCPKLHLNPACWLPADGYICTSAAAAAAV
jgi:hypothetical protein